LQERVRRVVLHRIRDTHTILADQWRLEPEPSTKIAAASSAPQPPVRQPFSSAC
jgi:hypothetical protein